MKIGYARISTPDQKLDLQLDALHQVGCERIFQDVMSSTRLDRPGLQAALSHLRPGDTFVIWKLDRLGRSVKGLITLTEDLKARGIAFVSLQDTIDTTGRSTVNRGYEHHRSIRRCSAREGRPRCFGGAQRGGGT